MNSHSTIRKISFLSLSIAVAVFGAVPTSFAAAKATPKPTAKAPAKATVKPNPKITKLPTTPTGRDGGLADGGRGGIFANITTAQRACLVKNGVALPAPRTSTSRPTANPSRSPGGFGGGGGFNNPKAAAAFKKCGVVLPTGGFAGQFNSAKFLAFQKCMTKAGFQPSGGFGRYDQSDPSTVAALIKCQKSSGFTLPKPGQPGSNN